MVFVNPGDDPEPIPLPSADEVRAEMADWMRRIDALYRTTVGWLPPGAGYEADQSWRVPVKEEMLRLNGLPSYEVPILQIRRDGRRCLLFHPDARWVMFTRGRVTVGIGPRRWDSLLAKVNDKGETEWRLVGGDNWQAGGDLWTESLLRSLLEACP